MDELELRRSVAELLGVSPEELQGDIELDSFESFDSVARLSLMVCLSDLTGRPFELCCLQRLRTYGDILALVNGTDPK
jgi:hypothetical protein